MAESVRILHVEDDANDQELVRRHIRKLGAVASVSNREEILAAIERGGFQVVLADSGVEDCSTAELIGLLQMNLPGVPLILVSGRSFSDPQVQRLLAVGAVDYVSKDKIDQLPQAIQHSLKGKIS